MNTIRTKIVEAFIDRFGDAAEAWETEGALYRWRLLRRNNLNVHVIIDSPEIKSQACPRKSALHIALLAAGLTLMGILAYAFGT